MRPMVRRKGTRSSPVTSSDRSTTSSGRAFERLHERRPGGFGVTALLRPAHGQPVRTRNGWLERAREAAWRGPSDSTRTGAAPNQARPLGGRSRRARAQEGRRSASTGLGRRCSAAAAGTPTEPRRGPRRARLRRLHRDDLRPGVPSAAGARGSALWPRRPGSARAERGCSSSQPPTRSACRRARRCSAAQLDPSRARPLPRLRPPRPPSVGRALRLDTPRARPAPRSRAISTRPRRCVLPVTRLRRPLAFEQVAVA